MKRVSYLWLFAFVGVGLLVIGGGMKSNRTVVGEGMLLEVRLGSLFPEIIL